MYENLGSQLVKTALVNSKIRAMGPKGKSNFYNHLNKVVIKYIPRKYDFGSWDRFLSNSQVNFQLILDIEVTSNPEAIP